MTVGFEEALEAITAAFDADPERLRAAVAAAYLPREVGSAQDARLHEVIGKLALRGTEPQKDALFDALFAAAEEAVARGVQDSLHFLDAVVEGGAVQSADGWASEAKKAVRTLWQWADAGLSRLVGPDDIRTLHAKEQLCICLAATASERPLELGQQLVERFSVLHGDGAASTMRARLICVHILINRERFEEALALATDSLSRFDGSSEPLVTLGERLVGTLQVRVGRIEQGLRTLEPLRCSGREAAELSIPRTMLLPEEPIAKAAERVRVRVATGSFTAPGTLAAICLLSLALQRAGRDDDAMAARRAYDAWLASAETGPKAAADLRKLARDFGTEGEHEEAARVLERLVMLERAAAQPDVYAIRDLENSMGLAYSRAGNRERALAILGPLSEALVAEGAAHALTGRTNYAGILVEAGRYAEARAVYEEVASKTEDADERRFALVGAAIAMRHGGEADAAAAALSALFDEMVGTRALGTELGARLVDELLGYLLPKKDRRALEVQQALLDATARKDGQNNPATWLEHHNLATVLLEFGELARAEEILRDVLAKQDAAFGPASKDALRTRRTLAKVLADAGRLEESEALRATISELSQG